MIIEIDIFTMLHSVNELLRLGVCVLIRRYGEGHIKGRSRTGERSRSLAETDQIGVKLLEYIRQSQVLAPRAVSACNNTTEEWADRYLTLFDKTTDCGVKLPIIPGFDHILFFYNLVRAMKIKTKLTFENNHKVVILNLNVPSGFTSLIQHSPEHIKVCSGLNSRLVEWTR